MRALVRVLGWLTLLLALLWFSEEPPWAGWPAVVASFAARLGAVYIMLRLLWMSPLNSPGLDKMMGGRGK